MKCEICGTETYSNQDTCSGKCWLESVRRENERIRNLHRNPKMQTSNEKVG